MCAQSFLLVEIIGYEHRKLLYTESEHTYWWTIDNKQSIFPSLSGEPVMKQIWDLHSNNVLPLGQVPPLSVMSVIMPIANMVLSPQSTTGMGVLLFPPHMKPNWVTGACGYWVVLVLHFRVWLSLNPLINPLINLPILKSYLGLAGWL